MRKKPKAVSSVVPTEDQEQIRLATWLALQGIRFTASANGGSRNYLEAAKLKRMGVSKGWPDVQIPIMSGGFGGLFIELKRVKGGKPTREQVDWIRYLREQGYYADFARGFDEAKEIVLHYLRLTPRAA